MDDEKKSADVLIEEIQKQSDSEVESILDEAEKEKEQLLRKARMDAEAQNGEILKQADRKVSQLVRQIDSGIQLELKRQRLQAREMLVQQLFDALRLKWEAFRKSAEYPAVIEEWILEGALAVGTESMMVIAGDVEKKAITRAMLDRVQAVCLEKLQRKMNLALSGNETAEGGVMVLSSDRRIYFDNRFSSRMKRFETEIKMKIIESLGGF